MKKTTENNQRLGKRLVAEFGALRDAMRDKKRIDKIYTVRTVELDLKPKEFDAEAVRVIRRSMGVSQAIFAQLLGVSVDLVSAWEQGHRSPSGPARRLLELMEIDRSRWIQMLEQGASRMTA